MKRIIQFAIILSICFMGDVIHNILNLPIPGSVLGMLVLLALLLSGVLKLSMIEDVSNFLLKHLSFFFIPAAVGLITCFSILEGKWIALLFISVVSTIIIVVVTGITVQILMKRRRSFE
ncbi:murein hydrolase transporter LrgA [Methanococcoides methylutens]|uniref:Murein hydrolase transporter LrgA n=1 Tax=Methanococcoides methylutens TaxID=2226 RepID=A0A099T3T1_METMT|nr:CidA/LrgA family protein [Methanococcoides methylutens]KGK98853.1 murein hydrolase transporter LrgA [Methanococcoides methylutens]